MSIWPYLAWQAKAGISSTDNFVNILKEHCFVAQDKSTTEDARPGTVLLEGASEEGLIPLDTRYLLFRPELMLDSNCLSFITSFSVSALRSIK